MKRPLTTFTSSAHAATKIYPHELTCHCVNIIMFSCSLYNKQLSATVGKFPCLFIPCFRSVKEQAGFKQCLHFKCSKHLYPWRRDWTYLTETCSIVQVQRLLCARRTATCINRGVFLIWIILVQLLPNHWACCVPDIVLAATQVHVSGMKLYILWFLINPSGYSTC